MHKPMASVKGSIPLWSTCLGCCPGKTSQSGRTTLECWFMHTIAPKNSVTGFSPYYLMFGRQPHFPVDIKLGLAPHIIMELNASKCVQKLKEHARWAQKKAEAFQAKEAQRHKCNYDKRGRAPALGVGGMVLVHVTAFKGWHKIQDRWENREYVMENWPYPNVPVYVVCPRDGEGHSQTLHRDYLLPINSNLEQGEKDKPIIGVGNDASPPPVPSVGNAPAESGPSGMVTSNSADSTPHSSPDWSAPLRCSTWTTRNWLPWRYQNFGLLADTGPTGIWDAWVDLCICLCVMICLYTIFGGMYSVEHTLLVTPYICQAQLTSASKGILLMQLLRWIPGQGREWAKGHLAQLQLP